MMAQIGYIGSISKHEIHGPTRIGSPQKHHLCPTNGSGQCTSQTGTRVLNEKLGAAGVTQCQGPCYSSMTTFDNLIMELTTL